MTDRILQKSGQLTADESLLKGSFVKNAGDCGCHDHDHGHSHQSGHVHEHGRPPEHVRPVRDDEGQTRSYSGFGVRFEYPVDWGLIEESGPDQTTITLQSPGTSYWTLSLFDDRPAPEQLVASVMEAYESSYEDLDVYEPEVQILGFPAVTRELDFVCLDLVNTAAMVAFQAVEQSVLVIYQGEDRELTTTRPVMEAITHSLFCHINSDSDDVPRDG